jgi:hypothetical protein
VHLKCVWACAPTAQTARHGTAQTASAMAGAKKKPAAVSAVSAVAPEVHNYGVLQGSPPHAPPSEAGLRAWR